MNEATGIVENGIIKVPASVRLLDGAKVRILWEDEDVEPIEREPLTEADVAADVRWATGRVSETGRSG